MNDPIDVSDVHDPDSLEDRVAQSGPDDVLALLPEDAAAPPSTDPESQVADDSALAPAPFAETTRRLAALGQVEYDLVRKQEAKVLNIRVGTLDAAVEDVRAAMVSVTSRTTEEAELRSESAGDDTATGYTTTPKAKRRWTTSSEDGVPPSFILARNGVFWGARDAGQMGKGELMYVCSPLRVTALVRDAASENWGRVLEFSDADGMPHRFVTPMSMLAADGTDLRKELAQQGLEIAPGQQARNRLVEYITSCKPRARSRCVQKTGWYETVFVLPDRTLGSSNEQVLFQSDHAMRIYAQAGTLDEWKQNIARLCIGNSRLTLAVCAAFAGPLLHLAGLDSGGIHFVGSSSIGKSTLLRVSASVFGGPAYIQTWRATGNGLEGLCALHNDTLLVLDEIGEVDPKEAGSIAYMIGNGAGKIRSDRHGDPRAKRTWRVLLLSSGEVGLAQHMIEGGKGARAGQEVRLIDLAADAGAGLGVFEELHDFDSGGDLSNALKEATRTFYGTAGLAFIEEAAANATALPAQLKDAIARFVSENLLKNAGGQAARVCARFAIMAAAGEAATAYGMTDWKAGAATEAAAICFQAWLDQRGGAGNRERATILAAVRAYFETHGEARFTAISADHDRVTVNRAGFRQFSTAGQEFYVFPEAYKREVCAGFDMRAVTKVLLEAGWLQRSRDDKSSQKKSLPGFGETRVYVVTSSMWRDSDAD